MTENKRFIVDYGQYCDVVYDNHESKVICRCVGSGDAEYVSEKLNNQYEENMSLESTNMEYEDALGRLEEQLKQNNQTIDLLFKQIGAFRDDCVVYMDFSGVATLDRLIEILEDSMGIMNGDDND